VSVNEARSFRCAGGRSRRWSLGRSSRTWTGKSTPVDLRSGRGRTKTFNWVLGLTRREAWRVLAAPRFLFRQREMLSGGYTLGRFSLRERDNVERVDSASF
jgi:hypothetical protein